jgi:excisionase family DNA binding protein
MCLMSTSQTTTKTRPLNLDDLRAEGVTMSVPRAGQYIGVSRAWAYEMAREGRLPTIKIGSHGVRVPTAALLRMLTAEDSG